MDNPEPPRARALLILAGLLTVVLWQFPWGHTLLWPFTLLATYAHELGHGLTALVLGADFEKLEMFNDGSGVAHWRGAVGRVGRGLIAAGGLVGPSVAGALLLMVSRNPKRAPLLLTLLGVGMLFTVVWWTRGIFAPFFVAAVAFVLILVARYGKGLPAAFLLQFVGMQLCLSVFSDLDYMFSPGAVVDGVEMTSDSGAIAKALFLPYWFWGALTALFSFLVLVAGLRVALRNPKPVEPQPIQV